MHTSPLMPAHHLAIGCAILTLGLILFWGAVATATLFLIS